MNSSFLQTKLDALKRLKRQQDRSKWRKETQKEDIPADPALQQEAARTSWQLSLTKVDNSIQSLTAMRESIETTIAKLESSRASIVRQMDMTSGTATPVPVSAAPTSPISPRPRVVGFTDLPAAVMTIVFRASHAKREALFACKRCYAAEVAFRAHRVIIRSDDGTEVTTFGRRILLKGNNAWAQCGLGSTQPWLSSNTWFRLPPVKTVFCGYCSVFARTSCGMVAWGDNTAGKLGVGLPATVPVVTHPRPVCLPGVDVTAVQMGPVNTFFRPAMDREPWHACGANESGQLGLGHTHPVAAPAPIFGSTGVVRWQAERHTTIAWSRTAVRAAGRVTADRTVSEFTPLHGMTGGRVTRIVEGEDARYMIAGAECVIQPLAAPGDRMALGIHVQDVVTSGPSALILSEGRLFIQGANTYRQFPVPQPVIPTPALLQLPWAIDVAMIGDGRLFVRTASGWYGRGQNASGALGVGRTEEVVDEWCPLDIAGLQACWTAPDATIFLMSDGLVAAGAMVADPQSVPGFETEVTVANRPRRLRRLPGRAMQRAQGIIIR